MEHNDTKKQGRAIVEQSRPIVAATSARVLAQQLYVSGLSSSKIAAKLGVLDATIRSWAKRGQWTRTRGEVKAIQATMILKESSKPPIELSKYIRQQASSVIGTDLAHIARSPIKTAKGAYIRQQKLEPLIRNAKIVLGWDEANTNTLININVLDPNDDAQLRCIDAQATVNQDQTGC